MVSPYLLRPLRSLQEAVEGKRAREQASSRLLGQPHRRVLKAEGPNVRIWDSRPRTGPRLVWTNAAREPARRP